MSDLSSSESPVLVIGNAGIDVIGRFKNQSQSGTSNPGHIRTSFGGVARNVAENLARLDQPVTLLSVVGRDSAGDDLLQMRRMPRPVVGDEFAVEGVGILMVWS